MALKYPPKVGTLWICDFNTGFKPPEMIKRRPVVVISPRRSTELCTIVPLSTTVPDPLVALAHRGKYPGCSLSPAAPIRISSMTSWVLKASTGRACADGVPPGRADLPLIPPVVSPGRGAHVAGRSWSAVARLDHGSREDRAESAGGDVVGGVGERLVDTLRPTPGSSMAMSATGTSPPRCCCSSLLIVDRSSALTFCTSFKGCSLAATGCRQGCT